MPRFAKEQVEMGKRIRDRRETLGLTQQQVADQLGVNRMTFVQYETGRNSVPAPELPRLAHYLRCSVGYLFGEHDDEIVEKAEVAQAVHFFASLAPEIQLKIIAEMILRLQGRLAENIPKINSYIIANNSGNVTISFAEHKPVQEITSKHFEGRPSEHIEDISDLNDRKAVMQTKHYPPSPVPDSVAASEHEQAL